MPKKTVTNKKSRRKSSKKKHSLPHVRLRTLLLFVLGIFLILLSVTWHIYEITKYSFTTPPPVQKKEIKRKPEPTFINIQGTSMAFPVFQTVIEHGVWQIADDGASHLALSANPGENGTILIYAHNTLVRFGSLPYVYIGQKITLTTKDGKTHTYTVKKTMVVSPNQTNILFSQKGEVLVLYTCYGFADLERFVVFAFPTN